MVKSRSAKMGVDFYVGDRTRAGLASVHRGFNTTMSSISRDAGVLSQGIGGMLTGNATFFAAAAGAAVLGFSAQAMGAFADVEKAWAEVTTLMPQRTKQATDQMLADIRSFSRETGFALQDSIQAQYQSISAGINPSQSNAFLGVAGQAARAGVTDLTTSVNALTSALNAYGEEAGQATTYSDSMFTAIRLGKTTFEEMAPVMGPVLPIAASLGTEFQEVTAAVASLTAQGNPTSIAMTQIRSALVALSKDTEARTIFESVMGMTYKDFQGQGGTLAEALRVIVDEAERTGQSVVDVFGRVEAANAALALTSTKGASTFKEAMDVTSGATEDAASKIESTLSTNLEKVGAWWSDIKVSVGQAVGGIAAGVLTAFGAIDSASSKAVTSVTEGVAEINRQLGLLDLDITAPGTDPDTLAETEAERRRRENQERRVANVLGGANVPGVETGGISELEMVTAFRDIYGTGLATEETRPWATNSALRAELEANARQRRVRLRQSHGFQTMYDVSVQAAGEGRVSMFGLGGEVAPPLSVAPEYTQPGHPGGRTRAGSQVRGGGHPGSNVPPPPGHPGTGSTTTTEDPFAGNVSFLNLWQEYMNSLEKNDEATRANTRATEENTRAVVDHLVPALSVRIDADVDQGQLLRTDTVERDFRAMAARSGNPLPNRVRSG